LGRITNFRLKAELRTLRFTHRFTGCFSTRGWGTQQEVTAFPSAVSSDFRGHTELTHYDCQNARPLERFVKQVQRIHAWRR